MHAYRVLIVENAREQRRALRAGLQSLQQKFEVLDVASGEEALLLLTRQAVDVLVSGYRLAGISGVELTQKAHLRHPDVKVILMAGKPDLTAARKAGRGVEAILTHPFELPEFLQAVQNCLSIPADTRPIPVEKAEKPPEPASSGGPGAWLKRLQKNAGAAAVLLLDETGAPLAQAGQLPQAALGTAFLPVVMAAMRSADSVSRELGAAAGGAQYWEGERYDACAARLGTSQLIVLILERKTPPADRALALAAVRTAQVDFHGLPAFTPAQSLPPVEKPAAKQELPTQPSILVEPDPALEGLFKQGAHKSLKTTDVDEFWDTLAGQSDGGNVVNSGAITYEQARRMGLAPTDNSG